MPYSDFKNLHQVQLKFNLNLEENRNLFSEINLIKPSNYLQQTLEEYVPLATAINTKKFRSEFIIAPILAEIRRQVNYQISLFSGTEFNVDIDKGLSGYCDYLISCSPEQYFINVPIITIVEAKNENIKGGLAQCAAEMIAGQIFNERENNPIPIVYGAVSTGTNWKFLTLEKQHLSIDKIEYYINQIDKILGILLSPINNILANKNLTN